MRTNTFPYAFRNKMEEESAEAKAASFASSFWYDTFYRAAYQQYVIPQDVPSGE